MKQVLQIFVLLLCVQAFAQKAPRKEKASNAISLEQLIQQKSSTYTITHEHTSSVSGIKHTYIRQAINGIDVYGTESSVHVSPNGNTITTHNNFLTDIQSTLLSSSATLSASDAISAIAFTMNYNLGPLEIVEEQQGINKKTVFNSANISEINIPAKLVYLYEDKVGTSIAWRISIQEKSSSDWWNFNVDATTGIIIKKENLTVSCNILGDLEDHDHSHDTALDHNISENIFIDLAEAPTALVGNYNVYAMPVESPNYGGRTMVADPDNAIASPFGWHDTNGVAGAEFTITRGNNAHAYEDGDNPGFSPDGGAGLVFNFPINETYSNADQSEAAAITNLFYWSNIIHDVVYQYGFDEASGNFQENNYGNGGAGSDSVNAEAQDGSGTCNANFGTPVDGNNPQMQMYVCGSRDGDLDNGVIIHEYGHGISNRLTGGAGTDNCLFNQEQMGEGWSDYYALMMTIEPGDVGPNARPIGTWLTGTGPTGASIRTFDYSTDFTINPHTYDDIMTESVPHGVGSVWAAMLWEMTWELIATDGFDPDIYNGTGGNNISLNLVTEAMKLQPCSPGFIDGRDAIIAADQAIYGGSHLCEIWEAFARRGLGFSATQGSSDSRSDGVESFDLPPTFSSFDTIDEVCLADGIQNGLGGGAPTGGTYSGVGVTDDGNGTTYTFDPSINGAGPVVISYATVDFCTGLPGILTDTILVTDEAPEIICKGAGLLVMNGVAEDAPALAIEDLNTVTTTINIPENVAITDLNVRLDITHSYVGDMIITLTAPGGAATATIFDGGADGCPGDNMVFLFDDESANALACNGAGNAFSEPDYTPSNPLTAFDGVMTQGDWTLSIQDTFNADPGVLNSWALEYTYELDSQPLDVFLDITQNATVNAEDFLESVMVACGGYTTLAGTPFAATVSFTIADVGLNNVEVQVTSDTGQVSICTAIANVIPNTSGGQEITCPENVILNCGDDTSPTNTGTATAISDCDPNPVVTFFDSSEPTCGNTEVITRTWVSADSCGNPIASCIQTITIIDEVAPTAECPMDIVIDTDPEQCTAVVDYVVNGADTCGNITVNQTAGLPSGSMFPIGTTVNTFDIVDDCGNVTPCSFSVTVENNTVPEAICQDITVQLDAMGMITIDAADVNGGSGAVCSSTNASIDVSTFTCENIGPNNVTLTVVDNDGNESSCVAIVTVEDMVAPEAICQNVTVQLDASGTATITAAMVDGGSTDACGIDSLEIDTTTFDCSNIGMTNEVTLTVTDIYGNVSSCTAQVTVEDPIFPTAGCQDITVELGADGTVTITGDDINNGSFDNCGDVTFELNPTTFDCSNLGTNEVNLVVVDSNGLASECFAVVTVIDTIAPTPICQDITITLDDDYMAMIDASDIDGGSTDNCTVLNTEIDIDFFDCSNIGENIVTLTVIDQSGNEATCTATVTVEEGIFPPNAVCQNVTVPIGQDGTATVLASAFDGGSSGLRCENALSIDRENFSCEDIGEPILIEFTVTNAAGQTDSCFAFVNVVDSLAPSITCPEDQSVTSDGPYILPDYFANGLATATDNCSEPLTMLSQDPAPGTPMEQGIYTITMSVQDSGGFAAECDFILVVDDLLGSNDNEIALATIRLYPNPADQFITLSNPRNVDLTKVSIYDITGRLVLTKEMNAATQENTIAIEQLQSGNYLVLIQSEFGQITKQLLKE